MTCLIDSLYCELVGRILSIVPTPYSSFKTTGERVTSFDRVEVRDNQGKPMITIYGVSASRALEADTP